MDAYHVKESSLYALPSGICAHHSNGFATPDGLCLLETRRAVDENKQKEERPFSQDTSQVMAATVIAPTRAHKISFSLGLV